AEHLAVPRALAGDRDAVERLRAREPGRVVEAHARDRLGLAAPLERLEGHVRGAEAPRLAAPGRVSARKVRERQPSRAVARERAIDREAAGEADEQRAGRDGTEPKHPAPVPQAPSEPPTARRAHERVPASRVSPPPAQARSAVSSPPASRASAGRASRSPRMPS